MPNRLEKERSPYLLQHAHNPVDWYPWGAEALETARRENRPILVSIGYAACHWCHVMERESFEDQATADLMNRTFVSIKVDREERPDVDAIYMEAVQVLTGQGGWPLNVFLLPDGRPFYGGTYFPPAPRAGLPSWTQVLQSVSDAYTNRSQDVQQNAEALTEYLQRAQSLQPGDAALSPEILRAAYDAASRQFDSLHGGFGSAPKFPQPLGLAFILRMAHRFDSQEARTFLAVTLREMADGGIYDQLGGGFHRYSVDATWTVPHFEKMLYDNALLARLYLQAFQATHEVAHRRIVEQTLEYLLRDMRSPQGAFYSAEDADSEGVEGKYYLWTPQELSQVLDEEAARVAALRFGVRPGGNFEGQTILTVAAPLPEIAGEVGIPVEQVVQVLQTARQDLLNARSQRVAPAKDTKVLVSWNALAIQALAEAGRILDRPEYLAAAIEAADFILTEMRPGGRLVRSYREGPSAIPAYLEDYAFLVEALLTLYETAFEPRFLEAAQELTQTMLEDFWDDRQGAFFDTAVGQDDLVVRPRGFYDNPIPSGNSAATFALLRLEALTGNGGYVDRAVMAFRAVGEMLSRAPLGFSYLLSALDFHLSPQLQVAILGNLDEGATHAMLHAVFEQYLPNKVVALGTSNDGPLLAGRNRVDDMPTAYLCERFTCRAPTTDPGQLEVQLATASRG